MSVWLSACCPDKVRVTDTYRNLETFHLFIASLDGVLHVHSRAAAPPASITIPRFFFFFAYLAYSSLNQTNVSAEFHLGDD